MSPQQELIGLRTILMREGVDAVTGQAIRPGTHRSQPSSLQSHDSPLQLNPLPARLIGGSVAHTPSQGVPPQGLTLGGLN